MLINFWLVNANRYGQNIAMAHMKLTMGSSAPFTLITYI
jgi:hypothetical protein